MAYLRRSYVNKEPGLNVGNFSYPLFVLSI